MKKVKLLLLSLLCGLFPFVVKADMGPYLFYSNAEVKDGVVNYTVKYTCDDEIYGSEFNGSSNIAYIKYDSNKLEYSSVSEVETKVAKKITVTEISKGVLKLTIEGPKSHKFEIDSLLLFKIKSSGNATIELISQVKYEKAGCVTDENALNACDDDFYSGQVVHGNEKRTVSVTYEQESNSIDEVATTTETTGSVSSPAVDNMALYVSCGINVLLVIGIVVIAVKKKKQ